MIEIKEVKTRRDLRKFAGFNEKMYRKVPQAIPDLISDEMANFNPKKNPAFEYAESRQFLAYKDGKCVGRIGAIINHKANTKWDRKRKICGSGIAHRLTPNTVVNTGSVKKSSTALLSKSAAPPVMPSFIGPYPPRPLQQNRATMVM